MSKKTELEKILNGVPVNELIGIIVQVAEKDESFRNNLLLKYNKKTSSRLAVIRRLIKSIVKKYAGRGGFIPCREADFFAREMLDVLEDASPDHDALHAIEVALLVLEEGIEALQYADDSNGDIGMLVNETLHRISEIAVSLHSEETKEREAIFSRMIEMCESNVFDGWEDFLVALLRICTEFGGMDKLRQRLISVIKKQIDRQAKKEYGQYAVESLLGILYELTTKYGTQEEADLFVQQHLHYTFFRKLAIETHMNIGNFQQVIQLAQDGERKDGRFPGLVSKWKSARYKAYKSLSLKEEQGILGKELLLDGEYDYYQDLEDLFAGDKEQFYRGILEELKREKGWRSRDVYLKLLADKSDTVEMMNYVRSNPSVIEEYAPKLFNLYAEEIKQLYEENILHAARVSSNRNEYRRICSMLKRFKKVIGEAAQANIIATLRNQYQKRPAFLDELSKL